MPWIGLVGARIATVVGLFAAGCGFDTSSPLVDSRCAGSCEPNAADAAAPESVDAAADGAAMPLCAPRSGLIACYRFEDNLEDESGLGNHASPSRESYTGGIDGRALVTGSMTSALVTEAATLDTATLTIEVWLRPDPLPPAGRAMVFDNDLQYGMFILPTGTVVCSGGGVSVESGGALDAGTWTHVACTHDGTVWTVYVGDESTTSPAGSPLSSAGNDGSRLAGNVPSGDEFVGALDNLRLWSIPRRFEDICHDAGTCLRPPR